jgi:hypothetical protein
MMQLSRIADEYKQWREPENRSYLGHYLSNAVKILFGCEPTDYRVVGHGNKLVHSSIHGIDDMPADNVSTENLLVHSRIYNPETGQSE